MTNKISNQKGKISISLDMFLLKDGNFITAYCPALELSAYGDTIDEAIKSFKITMEIFIDDTIQKGTLEKVLLGLGWSLKAIPKPEFKPPIFDANDIFKISKNILKTNKTNMSIPSYC